MGQRIGEVGIDPLLRDQHVRTEPVHEGRDHGFKSAQVGRIVGVRWQSDVDAVARAAAAPPLVGESGAGKEEATALVKRDGEDLVGLVERGLHPIAVVRVDVDVRDLHPAVGEKTTDDRRVVVDAETGGVTAHRVMEPA